MIASGDNNACNAANPELNPAIKSILKVKAIKFFPKLISFFELFKRHKEKTILFVDAKSNKGIENRLGGKRTIKMAPIPAKPLNFTKKPAVKPSANPRVKTTAPTNGIPTMVNPKNHITVISFKF